jgi:hypothetical protein
MCAKVIFHTRPKWVASCDPGSATRRPPPFEADVQMSGSAKSGRCRAGCRKPPFPGCAAGVYHRPLARCIGTGGPCSRVGFVRRTLPHPHRFRRAQFPDGLSRRPISEPFKWGHGKCSDANSLFRLAVRFRMSVHSLHAPASDEPKCKLC